MQRLEAALRWQATQKQDEKQDKSKELEENVEEQEEEKEGGLEAKRARAEQEPSTPAVKRRRGGAAEASPVPAAAATPATVARQPGSGGRDGAAAGPGVPPQRTRSDSATTLDMAETALAFRLGAQGGPFTLRRWRIMLVRRDSIPAATFKALLDVAPVTLRGLGLRHLRDRNSCCTALHWYLIL